MSFKELGKNQANKDKVDEEEKLSEVFDTASKDSKSQAFKNPTYYQKEIKNPGITHFNEMSHFIYDNYEAREYLKNIKDKNNLKLKEKEIFFLQNFIDQIKLEKIIKQKNAFIKVPKDAFEELENFFKVPKLQSRIELFLAREYASNNNRANFTCRKLSRKYEDETGEYISKSTINKLIKRRLGLKYLKTSPKTSKILYDKNKMISFAFIKVIVRCLKQNFSII